MADLIVVLDRGRIAELGSHDELMALAGLYAELFALQATWSRNVRGVDNTLISNICFPGE